jgi:hypothetical protein
LDALEFPDGRTVLLTLVHEGQAATVSRLPKSASHNAIDTERDLAPSLPVHLSPSVVDDRAITGAETA